MKPIVRVRVGSCQHPRRVDADSGGSQTIARACAGSVEGRYRAVGSADKFVIHTARVAIHSRDNPCVDTDGNGSRAPSARNIKGGYRAIGSAQETVSHTARVKVGSCDIPRGVDAEGKRSLVKARARARSVEGGYRSVGSAHEAVSHSARVPVDSRDIPRRVDADGDGSLIRARACARCVEGGEGLRLCRRGREDCRCKHDRQSQRNACCSPAYSRNPAPALRSAVHRPFLVLLTGISILTSRMATLIHPRLLRPTGEF